MAHFESTDLNKPAAPERVGVGAPPAKSRWWLWLLVVGVLVIGIWYYRGSHNKAEAESKNADANAPGGAGGGKGGRGGAGVARQSFRWWLRLPSTVTCLSISRGSARSQPSTPLRCTAA